MVIHIRNEPQIKVNKNRAQSKQTSTERTPQASDPISVKLENWKLKVRLAMRFQNIQKSNGNRAQAWSKLTRTVKTLQASYPISVKLEK